MLDTNTLLMKRSLELAGVGAGLVSPNPLVGAVLVNDGRVVGEGYHRYDLLKHAESYAIEAAGNLARGATLYCNLEPCCHHGRTPPCTDALIEAGIARAVIAVKDPDPRVNGRGIEYLRGAGVDVEVGLLEDAARRLNESYFKFMGSKLPLVHGIIEYPMEHPASALGWRPTTEFLRTASTYDAVMIGSRSELNESFLQASLSRVRHRPLVIVVPEDAIGISSSIRERGDSEVLLIPIGTQYEGDSSGNVLSLEEGMTHGEPRSQLSVLLNRLGRLDVTSVLTLPGSLDATDKSIFDELDKITLAVPSSTRDGFGSLWSLGDFEFDLEDVRLQEAGDFTEVTGYPSLREVA